MELMPSVEVKKTINFTWVFAFSSILKHLIQIIPGVLILEVNTLAQWLVYIQVHTDCEALEVHLRLQIGMVLYQFVLRWWLDVKLKWLDAKPIQVIYSIQSLDERKRNYQYLWGVQWKSKCKELSIFFIEIVIKVSIQCLYYSVKA